MIAKTFCCIPVYRPQVDTRWMFAKQTSKSLDQTSWYLVLYRKGTLLLNNIFSIVPAILMGCSEVAKSFEMIILSRLLVGICAGKRCHTALPFRDLEKPGGGRTGAGMRSHLGPCSTDPSCSSAASRDDARAPTLASRADNGQIFPVLFPGKKAVLWKTEIQSLRFEGSFWSSPLSHVF